MTQVPLILIIIFALAVLGRGDASSLLRNETLFASLWLSDAAYCPPETYLSHKYIGPSENFRPSYVFADESADIYGYAGQIDKLKTIFVIFRGSASTKNWISDLDYVLTPYSSCESCLVHHGFLTAYSTILAQVESAVLNLRRLLPNYDVVVSGHSLGGALATLASLNLLHNHHEIRAEKLFLVTFGSPRVGNDQFSQYAAQTLPNIMRYTHLSDPVPHLPPRDENYIHFPKEFYEDESGAVHECVEAEDDKCSAQWCYEVNFNDHMQYLGLNIGCQYVTEMSNVPDLK